MNNPSSPNGANHSMRKYALQLNRTERMPFFDVPRVDYGALCASLKFPVLWIYDLYLEAWLPTEIDGNLADWLGAFPPKTEALSSDLLSELNLTDPPSRVPLAGLRSHWEQYGFVIIPQLVPGAYARNFLTTYFYRQPWLHKRWNEGPDIRRLSANDLPLMRVIHQGTERLINAIVSAPIKCSYSFASAYQSGSALPPHKDRPQCVYNLSLICGSRPDHVSPAGWPLYIKHDGKTSSAALHHGDAVLYSGVNDEHWREKMPPEIQSVFGVFFHYVPEGFQGRLE